MRGYMRVHIYVWMHNWIIWLAKNSFQKIVQESYKYVTKQFRLRSKFGRNKITEFISKSSHLGPLTRDIN